MRRVVWTGLVTGALAMVLLAPAGAQAGTYDVVSCRAPGAGGVNLAWQPTFGAWPPAEPQPTLFNVTESCSSAGGAMSIRSLAADGFEAGWLRSASYRFTAPSGTAISRVRLWRWGQSARADAADGGGDEWDVSASADVTQLPLEGCAVPADGTACTVGTPEPGPLAPATAVTYNLSAPFVQWGIVCNPAGLKNCPTANAGGGPYGALDLYGAVVTVRDDARPALAASGSLWSDGWRRPDEPLNVVAADAAGVRTIRADIGGIPGVADGSCDFRRPAPCTARVAGRLRFAATPPDGTHVATITAVDAAGNSTRVSRSLAIDGNPPRVELRPPRGKTMIVRVHDDGAGVAGGQLFVRQDALEPYRALPTTVRGGSLRARLDRGRPSRTDLRVVASDAIGNQAAGRPARFTVRDIRSRQRRLKLIRRNLTVGYGRPVTFRGKLTLSADQPLTGVAVQLVSTPAGGGVPTQESVATTGRRGRFALRATPGASRELTLAYGGGNDTLAAVRRVHLKVRAKSSIRASRRRLSGSGTVRFRGRVAGGGAGLVIVLQGKERGRWRTFADTRTGPRGRWRAAYRFSGRPGTYPIRARVRRQAALPYATGYSRVVSILVG